MSFLQDYHQELGEKVTRLGLLSGSSCAKPCPQRYAGVALPVAPWGKIDEVFRV